MARAVAQDVENEVAKSVENVFVRPEKNEDNMKPEENDTDIQGLSENDTDKTVEFSKKKQFRAVQCV